MPDAFTHMPIRYGEPILIVIMSSEVHDAYDAMTKLRIAFDHGWGERALFRARLSMHREMAKVALGRESTGERVDDIKCYLEFEQEIARHQLDKIVPAMCYGEMDEYGSLENDDFDAASHMCGGNNRIMYFRQATIDHAKTMKYSRERWEGVPKDYLTLYRLMILMFRCRIPLPDARGLASVGGAQGIEDEELEYHRQRMSLMEAQAQEIEGYLHRLEYDEE